MDCCGVDDYRCCFVRGQSWNKVFLFSKTSDYEQYLRLLRKYKSKYELKVFAFCLTPHDIFLIIQPRRQEDLLKFLHQVTDEYVAKYAHDLKGKVRFRRNIIKNTEDLIDWIKYLEFLPVRYELSLTPVTYRWSSCSYRVLGDQHGLLDSRSLWSFNNSPQSFPEESCP